MQIDKIGMLRDRFVKVRIQYGLDEAGIIEDHWVNTAHVVKVVVYRKDGENKAFQLVLNEGKGEARIPITAVEAHLILAIPYKQGEDSGI